MRHVRGARLAGPAAPVTPARGRRGTRSGTRSASTPFSRVARWCDRCARAPSPPLHDLPRAAPENAPRHVSAVYVRRPRRRACHLQAPRARLLLPPRSVARARARLQRAAVPGDEGRLPRARRACAPRVAGVGGSLVGPCGVSWPRVGRLCFCVRGAAGGALCAWVVFCWLCFCAGVSRVARAFIACCAVVGPQSIEREVANACARAEVRAHTRYCARGHMTD